MHGGFAVVLVLAAGVALTSDAAMKLPGEYAYAWPTGPYCKQRLERNPNFGNNLRLRANGTRRPHLGVDLIPPAGDLNVYAAGPGVVVENSPARGSGWGNYVVVRHADGLRTLYGHLVTKSPLAVGSKVARGDVIGTAGLTETSYVHVHFEVLSPAQREAWAKGRIDPQSVAGPLRRCRNSASYGQDA